jgi:hypothetical protein
MISGSGSPGKTVFFLFVMERVFGFRCFVVLDQLYDTGRGNQAENWGNSLGRRIGAA